MPHQLNANSLNEAASEQVRSFYKAFSEVYSQTEPTSNAENAARLQLPSRFGQGEFCARSAQHSTISSTKLCFKENTYLTEKSVDSFYFISASLGTDVTFQLMNQRRSEHFPSQTLCLGFTPADEELGMAMTKDKWVHSLSFSFSKHQLSQYLTAFDRPDLIQKLKENCGMQAIERATISPRHRHLISKLTNNPYCGTLNKLYFESISGELMIALMESLCAKNHVKINLTGQDKELLRYAKKLLLEDVQNPPTISQLARLVGLNEDKLKKGFKIEFNNTVFKTLTEYRMQQAMENIQKYDVSVTKAAHDAGYENVSKFISAFRRTFGKTPGMMRKEVEYSLPAAEVVNKPN